MGCGSSTQPTVTSSEVNVPQQTAPLPSNNKVWYIAVEAMS